MCADWRRLVFTYFAACCFTPKHQIFWPSIDKHIARRRQFAQISPMGLSTSLLLSSGWLKRSYSGSNVFTVTFESPLWICVSIKSWLLYIEFPSVPNELGMNVGICAAELLSHGATRLCASWWAKVNCIGPTLLRQESSTAACSEWIRKWPNVTQSNMQKRSLNKFYLF